MDVSPKSPIPESELKDEDENAEEEKQIKEEKESDMEDEEIGKKGETTNPSSNENSPSRKENNNQFKDTDQEMEYTVKKVIYDNSSPVLSIKFSPDGKLILMGCFDGHLRVFDATDGRALYNWNTCGEKNLHHPITNVKFRPYTQTKKSVVLVCGSGGLVQHWHLTSGRVLSTLSEKGNSAYCVDYRWDGKYFATGGKDSQIRIYDEATKQLSVTLKGSEDQEKTNEVCGHTSRVFSVKFHPVNQNLLVSGGWDSTVQIWDKRTSASVRHISGPHLCGDSLDIDESGVIVTGSWRPENQIELWDLGSAKLIQEIQLPFDLKSKKPLLCYSTHFSPSNYSKIATAGSGSNEAKIFDRQTNKIVASLSGLENPLFSLAFSPDSSTIATAGADGNVFILNNIKK